MSREDRKDSCCGAPSTAAGSRSTYKSLDFTLVPPSPKADEKQASSCCSGDEAGIQTAEGNNAGTPCCAAGKKETGGQQRTYTITGMDCPSCANTIVKGLKNVPAIQDVTVNFNTSKMQVYADDAAAFDRIPGEVKKLGFAAEEVRTAGSALQFYEIEGMDCGSCALTIENHLKKLPNVKQVEVNFSTGKMRIEHDDSIEDIVKEVAKIGYKATPASRKRKTATEGRANSSGNALITLSGVTLLLGFVGSFTGVSPTVTTFLYLVSMIAGGYKPVKSAYYALKSRSLDMNVLMSAAAIGAALIGEWFEGATVVWLFGVGNVLQNRSIDKTRESIRKLMDLTPPEAWVQKPEGLVRVPVEDVAVGQTVVVKPGERIPLDGEVRKGTSTVNQAPITGESIPVDKQQGDFVYAGTINEEGSLEIRVTKLVEDTTVAKIIQLVEEAQEKKAPTEAFVDRFASIYTPVVFLVALLVIGFPPLLGWGTRAEWFYRGLELLVVACPCALVISTPVAIVSAIGNAAKNGVLIKGGAFLEIAGKIDAIAFDKTGTLTEGKPKVTFVEAYGVPEQTVLSIARTLEEQSKHPIAQAIVQHAVRKSIPMREGEGFRAIVGKGVQATIDGTEYFAGNLKLFQEMNVPIGPVLAKSAQLQNEGNSLVLVGTRDSLIGMIAVADTIRGVTVDAVSKLKGAGVRELIMLTGDNEGTAKNISSQAGVTRYFADLLPEQKVDAVKQMQQEGYKVAMVGDGINDAPALATADLGIAMGGAGTDTAMETADIVLMADNLEKLPHTIRLSRQATTIIKQNIVFSLVVKFIALALIFPGWLTLWLAVLSDTGAAILVILNSMRLLALKEK
ncbi:heavy metal translocating P-type ATPase [Paenibacillus sp.]|uniref:heavy metal translocating P-type ATPase n=1 Tax=Paenibacillus sp. TaxID=58172 RepID=UPI002D38AC41|nr:heavy metal translocating P-type ATPase [Paenibacillus sp.]HZG87916.1 heavy metal translocating P-type ATPase [Paenibacillus sp.]